MGSGMTFDSSYWEVKKIKGLRNWDSTLHIIVLSGVQKYNFTVTD